MPAFPQLPTDNLYKFLALAGIVLFLVGYATPFYVYSRAFVLVQETQKSLALLELQIDADSLAVDILEFQQKTDTSAAFESRLHALRARVDSTRRQKIMLDADAAASHEAVSWLRTSYVFGMGNALAGLIIAAYGFILWYLRLQRPLDKLVQAELEAKLHDIGETS